MESRIGCELPYNTDVYSWSFRFKQPTLTKKVDYLRYVFESRDGFWASCAVREFWEIYPHLHPYSTLFDLLAKKLEISSS
jgi:hypothetical protein